MSGAVRAGLAAASLGAALPAAAAPRVVLEAVLPEAPESVAFTPDGRLFATLYATGEVVEILPDGRHRLLVRLPGTGSERRGYAMGLESDREGRLYVAFRERSEHDATDLTDDAHRGCRDATVTATGLYRIDPASGRSDAVATRASGWTTCFPNDVAVADDGTVYVSDFTYAAIWRISPGYAPQLWSNHRWLQWAPAPWSIAPVGVNPLQLSADGRHLYAGTVGTPMILRFAVAPTASDPEIVQRDGGPSDGLTVDADGTLYVSEILRSELWALRPDGRERYLVANARNAPLDGNAGLARFGNRLCVANVGFPKTDPATMRRTVVCLEGFEPPWHTSVARNPLGRP